MTGKPVGNRGSWFAEVDGERLPCVHEFWTKHGRYDDPGCMPALGKWPKFIKAIKDDRKVLLTRSKVSDAPLRKSGKSLARSKYLSVWEVDEVEADDLSLRFRYGRKLKSFHY
jgi:hypothetical protein